MARGRLVKATAASTSNNRAQSCAPAQSRASSQKYHVASHARCSVGGVAVLNTASCAQSAVSAAAAFLAYVYLNKVRSVRAYDAMMDSQTCVLAAGGRQAGAAVARLCGLRKPCHCCSSTHANVRRPDPAACMHLGLQHACMPGSLRGLHSVTLRKRAALRHGYSVEVEPCAQGNSLPERAKNASWPHRTCHRWGNALPMACSML